MASGIRVEWIGFGIGVRTSIAKQNKTPGRAGRFARANERAYWVLACACTDLIDATTGWPFSTFMAWLSWKSSVPPNSNGFTGAGFSSALLVSSFFGVGCALSAGVS